MIEQLKQLKDQPEFFFFILINLFILTGRQSFHNTLVAPATYQHESATGAHVPPLILNPFPHLSPPHPSGLSKSTGFECPTSCIQLAWGYYELYWFIFSDFRVVFITISGYFWCLFHQILLRINNLKCSSTKVNVINNLEFI